MSEARGLGRETLWYAAANVASGALSLVCLSLFPIWIGKVEFGSFALILAWASILTAVAFAWINQTIKRYYAGLESAARIEFMGRIAAAYLLTLSLLLLVALLGTGVLAVLHQPLWMPWSILGLTVGTAAPQYVQWLFSIRRQPADYAVNQVLYNVARLVLGWLLLQYVGLTGNVLAWSVTLAGLLAGIEGWLRLREPYGLEPASFTPAGLRPLWGYGWPLTLVNGGGWLMTSAARVVLEPLAGKGAVGVFSAAQQLAQQAVQLVVTPVVTAADPLAIRVHLREGPSAVARFLSQLLGLLIVAGGGICLVLTLLSVPLTAALWNAEYADAARLFAWLGPAMLFWLVSPVLLKSQELGEQLGELPWLTVGAGVLNIGLNFALIPGLGTLGAALAMLVANLAFAAACYWRGRRHLHWPLPWKLLALTVFAMLATTGISLALPTPAGKLQCAGAFAAYMLGYLAISAVVMLALRGFFHEELAFVRQIASRRASA